ncbi:MAG: hypothetical protein ACLFQA_10385 [Bacteroidales bacterium]
MEKDLIDPQQFISIINGEINDLAQSTVVICWLRGDEKYARFAAILAYPLPWKDGSLMRGTGRNREVTIIFLYPI